MLCKDFAPSSDPIFPPGVKSEALLESAVNRQQSGWGDYFHTTIPSVMPTLTYGICSNHPFHNGNKRTSLVAMLAHLDTDDFTLRRMNETCSG